MLTIAEINEWLTHLSPGMTRLTGQKGIYVVELITVTPKGSNTLATFVATGAVESLEDHRLEILYFTKSNEPSRASARIIRYKGPGTLRGAKRVKQVGSQIPYVAEVEIPDYKIGGGITGRIIPIMH